MHISPTAILDPSSPFERARAADRLSELAGAATTIAERAAARFDAAGTRVTRGDLLLGLFDRTSPSELRTALDDAIDGALSVAPELEGRRASLHASAGALAHVLEAAARDRVRGRAWDVFDALYAALDTPVLDLLDAAAQVARPAAV